MAEVSLLPLGEAVAASVAGEFPEGVHPAEVVAGVVPPVEVVAGAAVNPHCRIPA